jgi:glycosyltransferase involved in cell wall biosynthesis
MFILQALEDPAEFDWRFAISPAVEREVRAFGARLPDSTVVLEQSPARNNAYRRKLVEIVEGWAPDLVFTLHGPAYVKFSTVHLLGCNDGWVTLAGCVAYRSLRPPDWLRYTLISCYKAWWYRRADAWFTESEAARRGMHRRLRLPLEDCFVVTNSCGDHYRIDVPGKEFPVGGQKVRLLCFAGPYRHKNLQFVPWLAVELEKLLPSLDFEFVLTIAQEHSEWRQIAAAAARLRVEHRICNVGPVRVVDGPALYKSCDICFLPTVLETFSATYPEAMAMGLPIITTDLDFARAVCHDAALFYSPYDAQEAAEQIVRLLSDEPLWRSLVERGRQIVSQLPDSTQRYQMFLNVIRVVLARACQSSRGFEQHSAMV